MSNNTDAYGSMIGTNGLLINNSANLLINGTNSNKINLMNNKTSTLTKPNAQLKSTTGQSLANSNPYNTLNSMNSKNEKSSINSNSVHLQPASKVKKIYL